MALGRTNASGGATLGFWKFTYAPALPEAVTAKTYLAITENAVTSTVLSFAAPETPADGMLWFQLADPTDGLALSSTAVPFRCMGAYQYNGAAETWDLLTAYYAYLGTWQEIPGLPPVGTALASCSWEQINRIGASGKAVDYFCIGDEKPITLSTSEVITLQIIGFNHDNLSAAGGGKAPITLGFKNCMDAKQSLNPTATNAGGYSGCALYPTINNAIYDSLPADLRAVMKNVNKLTSAGNQSTAIVTTQEKLFLFSEVEIFGGVTHSKAGEGTQYAFFTNGGARVKTVAGVASNWWERSPRGDDKTNFGAASSTGTAIGHYGANIAYGIALGLCV